MKNWFLICMLLTGNHLFAQVIPVGFMKSKVQLPIVKTGLIINLDAANKTSYSGSGTTWSNLISFNNVPSFTLSSASYASDYGGIIRFTSSTSSYASSSSGFSNLTAYTVEVWVKTAGTRGVLAVTTGNYFPCFFSEEVSGGTVNVALMYNLASFGASANTYQYGAALGQWKYTVSPDSYLSDVGQWVQIVQTYTGSVLSLYRNGTLLNSTTIIHTLRASSSKYNIAKRWDQSDAVYGDYSMVNMYSRALSADEIATNYSAFRSRFY